MNDAEQELPKEWTLSPRRARLAAACEGLGACAAVSRIAHALHGGSAIRVVNYHQTLAVNAATLAAQFRWYAQRFCPATAGDLRSVLGGDPWRRPRPGIVLTFDDGLRSNFEVAAPLLERHGLRGWFFVPTGFIDCPAASQRAYASRHNLLGAILEPRREDDRVAMTWQELRELTARGHEVGSHTQSHARLGEDVDPGTVRREVLDSKSIAEARLGVAVRSFCWVGGELSSYSRRAAECIAEAGYEFAFQTTCGLVTRRTSPLQIPRTNVEDRWPLEMASFQTSGILDLAYVRKRRAVRARTAACTPPA